MKKPGHMVIVVSLVALILYLVLTGGKTISRDTGNLFLFTCGIQFFRSSRKYGFVKTTELYATLLFVIIGYTVTLLDSRLIPKDAPRKISEYDADIIAQNLKTLVCEDYSCTIEQVDIQEDGFYIYLKMPYGIYPPFGEIIKKLAVERSIPADQIKENEITSTKVYFFFPNDALSVYISYSVFAVTKNDMKILLDKLLLRSPSI